MGRPVKILLIWGREVVSKIRPLHINSKRRFVVGPVIQAIGRQQCMDYPRLTDLLCGMVGQTTARTVCLGRHARDWLALSGSQLRQADTILTHMT